MRSAVPPYKAALGFRIVAGKPLGRYRGGVGRVTFLRVIPAQAGIQGQPLCRYPWTPAFAGGDGWDA